MAISLVTYGEPPMQMCNLKNMLFLRHILKYMPEVWTNDSTINMNVPLNIYFQLQWMPCPLFDLCRDCIHMGTQTDIQEKHSYTQNIKILKCISKNGQLEMITHIINAYLIKTMTKSFDTFNSHLLQLSSNITLSSFHQMRTVGLRKKGG